MSTKINHTAKIQGKTIIQTEPVIPIHSGLQQNVFGTPTLTGYFFGGFGPGRTLNDVQVGWFANDVVASVTNAVVTHIDVPNQTITIEAGRGLFIPGLSYTFYNTRQ